MVFSKENPIDYVVIELDLVEEGSSILVNASELESVSI